MFSQLETIGWTITVFCFFVFCFFFFVFCGFFGGLQINSSEALVNGGLSGFHYFAFVSCQ